MTGDCDAPKPRSAVPGPILALAVLLAAILMSGCSAAPPDSSPPAGGGMGMGGGGEAEGMISGVVCSAECAALDVGHVQDYEDGITVARVLAPDDGWVVLRSAVDPGGVLGFAPVKEGENRDVKVRLARGDTAEVRVALHVDRGRLGEFEYDGSRPDSALDKPVYVDGRPVERAARVERYGVVVQPNSALVLVEDQPGGAKVLHVRYVITPVETWISVNRLEGGAPGARVGSILVRPGEWMELDVPLKNAKDEDELVVTLHADRGARGQLEYRTADPIGSPDQPLASAGVVVSQRVKLE